ncbi:MAG: 1,4-alpha-glucan-branching enzyme, partial [Bacteroidales bacterium]|nr:1,4-alpha-glucan-branching enzyme [Bacteroidales bacterium]
MKPLPLALIQNDPSLKFYERIIQNRLQRTLIKAFDFTHGKKKLSDCFNGHLYYGLHQTKTGWAFREWAPNATNIWMVG